MPDSLRCLILLAGIALLPATGSAQEQIESIISSDGRHNPVLGSNGIAATQNSKSSQVGADILAAGGNAIDAAVAVGFSLAVTQPRSGNIGGGGFLVYHDAESDREIAIDYREMAPKLATRDMFLDGDEVDIGRARFSHLSAGVPGTVAGLYLAHQTYGRLPWKDVLQPAIRQARDGVTVSHNLADSLAGRKARLCRLPAACRYLFKTDGVPYKPGDLMIQQDLARTLEMIAEDGPDTFYLGEIADIIAADMKRHGGLVDKESLAAYKPVVRELVRGNYRGYEIAAMPPPSSGGVHLIQMLNMLEHFPVGEMGFGSADAMHLLAEVARLAFADRSEHLGDPGFYDVPVEWLTSEDYAEHLAATIDMRRARPSDEVKPGVEPRYESDNTTHFVIVDGDGNFVSNTYTLNFSYGSHIAVDGAGFLLNNEMDDFSAQPMTPNGYGLLGGEANAIESDKRPLSSMTPVIVFADGEPWFAAGSLGGPRIITGVLQVIVNIIDHKMNLAEATVAPRMHHQWYPDSIRLEDGFSPDTLRILRERGHTIEEDTSVMGSVQAAGMQDGVFMGATDSRRPDSGSVAPPRN